MGCTASDCLHVLQEHDKEGDSPTEDDEVTAFLEEEIRKDPPRLDFEGFQSLVRTFCERAGVPTEQASPQAWCKLIAGQPCSRGCHGMPDID